MKRISFSKLTGVLFAVVLFITACKTEIGNEVDALAKQIPADAAIVTSMNFQNLLGKADFESVKNMAFYKQTLEEAEKDNPTLAEIMKDPSKSGVDLKKNAYVFAKNDEDKKRQIIGGLLMSLEDKNTFEELLQRLNFKDIGKADGFQYTNPANGNGIVAWNDEMVYITGANRGTPQLSEVSKLFVEGNSNTVANAPNFSKAMSEDHDFSSWINLNPIVNNLPPMVLFGSAMAGVSKEDMLDNYMYANWDFEDGTMKGMLDYEMKDAITKDFSLLFKNTIKTDFSNKIPGENLIAAVTLALDFKGLNQVLNEKGFLGTLNERLEETGMEFKDLAIAFGGDLALSIYKDQGNEDQVLFTSNIIDKNKAEEFFKSGVRNKVLESVGANKYLLKGSTRRSLGFLGRAATNGDLFLLVKGDLLYLSTSTNHINLIENGSFTTAASGNKDINDVLSSSVFGVFADFELMDKVVKDMDLSHFKNLKISGNRENTTVLLDTNSPNENSLKTLMKMMNQAYLKENTEADSEEDMEI